MENYRHVVKYVQDLLARFTIGFCGIDGPGLSVFPERLFEPCKTR